MDPMLGPASLFSALAFAVAPGSDADLAPGTHLRLFAGQGASFPLGPFIVRGVSLAGDRRRAAAYAQDGRGQAASLTFGRTGFLDLSLVLNDPEDLLTTSVELAVNNGDITRAELVDQHGRTLAVRDRAPFVFAGPVLRRLRVWGSGTLAVIQQLKPLLMAQEMQFDRESILTVMDLPVMGDYRWHLGVQDDQIAYARVERGAPLRSTPMDDPVNILSPSAAEENARVGAALARLQVPGGIPDFFDRMLRDAPPPWAQTETLLAADPTPNGRPQAIHINRLGTLQLAAADPGIARYLGLADLIPDLPGRRWNTLIVIGLFAFDAASYAARGLDLSAYAGVTAADRAVQIYANTLSTALGRDVSAEVGRLVTDAVNSGLSVAAIALTLEAVPPYLPPEVPKPLVLGQHWEGLDGTGPASTFSARFLFEDLPLVTQAALARQDADGSWISLNRLEKDAARGVPLLFGSAPAPAAQVTPTGLVFGNGVFGLRPCAQLSSHHIPGGGASGHHRVWASDVFGRFSEQPCAFDVAPPPRPLPPPPVLNVEFERRVRDIGPGVSAGVVRLRVAVPEPLPAAEPFPQAEVARHGSAVVVPRLDTLAAGSYGIVSLEIGMEGLPAETIPLAGPGLIEREIAAPGGQHDFTLVARYVDTAGQRSEQGRKEFHLKSDHEPVLLKTGVGLLWSSVPGPGAEVEVRLKWNAVNGHQYRVYLADQAGMGITTADLAEELGRPVTLADQTSHQPGFASRGLIAAKGADLPGHKPHFRLITNQPITAANGVAMLETKLPRSLESVQFLRIVPLGADGDEAPFESCGIVPVAVPEGRHPAPPDIIASLDAGTGAVTLTVSTDAASEAVLRRDEPGLFDPAKPGRNPPVAMIRRAVAAVADPVYARPVKMPQEMTRDPATGRWQASFTDDNEGHGLVPIVSYIYWAEWRMPPERRLPASYGERPGEITAVDDAGGKDHPRPRSLLSAPRTVMRLPAELPAAPDAASVHTTRLPGATPDLMTLKIDIDDPPRAPRLAQGRYRLAVWTQWAGGPIVPLARADGADLGGSCPDIESGSLLAEIPAAPAGVSDLTLILALIDPAGRMGAMTTLAVP